MSEIWRYEVNYDKQKICLDDEGDLVYYSDHVEAISACQQELAAMRQALKDVTEPRTMETAPSKEKVLLYFKNAFGKTRTCVATFYPRWTEEVSEEDADEAAEYSEENDEYYLLEGWYEQNEFDEIHWRVGAQPLGWLPIPKPKEA